MAKRKKPMKNVPGTAKKSKEAQVQECAIEPLPDCQPQSLHLSENNNGPDSQAGNENNRSLPSQVPSYLNYQEEDDYIFNDCPDVIPQSTQKAFSIDQELYPAQSLSPPLQSKHIVTKALVHAMPNNSDFEDLPDVVLSQHSYFRTEMLPTEIQHSNDPPLNDLSKGFPVQKNDLSSQPRTSPTNVTRNVYSMQLTWKENNSKREMITSERNTAKEDQQWKDNIVDDPCSRASGSQHTSPCAELSTDTQNYFVKESYATNVTSSKPSSFAYDESKQICPLQESFEADSPSNSLFCSINNNNEEDYVISPVIRQNYVTRNLVRPDTPILENPILPMPLEDLFSPNTKKSIKQTIDTLFPELVPQPVIPVKKRKKSDVPYIVGCTKRKKVPEKRTLDVFKGDKYGITSETNAIENENFSPRKRGRRPIKQYPSWSKSKFNPKSDEIAARLKLNEKVDELLRKSPGKETDLFMTKPYSFRPQAFSPLPSTSKDNDTIMKNEKHFNESLNYDSGAYEIADDEELPEVIIDANKDKKKKHVSLIRSKDMEFLNKDLPIVTNDHLDKINDIEFDEFDFTKIKINKSAPETTVNRSNSPDNFKLFEPSETVQKTATTIDTIEINDDHEDGIGSLSNVTPVIEVDNLFGECNALKESTIINQASHNQNISSTLSNTKSAPFIEPPNIVEPVVSNRSSIKVGNPKYTWNEDIEFISETRSNSETTNNEHRPQNNGNITATPLNNDIGNIVNCFFSGQSSVYDNRNTACRDVVPESLNNFLRMLSMPNYSLSDYCKEKRRKRKQSSGTNKKTPNKALAPKDQPEQIQVVNNENADPSSNAQTAPMNGVQRLGDCPICMENLSKNSIASTTCGHVFCLECIKTCLRTSGKKCPTCRKQLKGVGYHQVFL